jgi:hypothetical protein
MGELVHAAIEGGAVTSESDTATFVGVGVVREGTGVYEKGESTYTAAFRKRVA